MKWEDFRRSDNVEDRTGMDSRRRVPGGGGMRLGGGALILIVDREPALRRESADADRRARLRRARAAATRRSRAPGYGPQRSAPAPGAQRRAAGPGEGILRARSRRHRRRLGRDLPGGGHALRAAEARALSRRRAARRADARTPPWARSIARRIAPSTSTPPSSTSSSRRFKAPGRFRAGLRDRARGRPSRAEPHRHDAAGRRADAARMDERGRNALSVRLELQADCYAGVWGYFAQKRNVLDAGDLEEGFAAASAIGDDQIQKRTQGYVVPESFTHGSAEQRLRWFKTRPRKRRHAQAATRSRAASERCTATPPGGGLCPRGPAALQWRPPPFSEYLAMTPLRTLALLAFAAFTAARRAATAPAAPAAPTRPTSAAQLPEPGPHPGGDSQGSLPQELGQGGHQLPRLPQEVRQ